MRRELAVSLAVQGAGAASVLLATLWLGATQGPQLQGSFSRAKSTLEFVGAFATFGLPQALFFQVRAGRLGRPAALRWVLGATALGLPIGAAVAWLADRSASIGLAAALAVAVAAFVAHGQLRALLLVRDRATRFNVATALPQVLTLVGLALLMAVGWDRGGGGVDARASVELRWFGLFACAYGLGAALAWRSLPRDFAGTPPTAASGVAVARGSPVAALLRYGLAAWLTAGLATAAILAVQHWVEASAGAVALGRYTMATTLTQVPLTPIAYAAPLLLRRWTHEPGAGAARRWSAALFLALLGVAALVALGGLWRDDLGLGPAYAGATPALATLLVGGAAEAASRVLAVQANATGLPWVAVRAELARAAVLVVAWALLPRAAGWLAICAAWSLAAVAAAAVLAWHGRAAR